jgi:hypothetical protein
MDTPKYLKIPHYLNIKRRIPVRLFMFFLMSFLKLTRQQNTVDNVNNAVVCHHIYRNHFGTTV